MFQISSVLTSKIVSICLPSRTNDLDLYKRSRCYTQCPKIDLIAENRNGSRWCLENTTLSQKCLRSSLHLTGNTIGDSQWAFLEWGSVGMGMFVLWITVNKADREIRWISPGPPSLNGSSPSRRSKASYSPGPSVPSFIWGIADLCPEWPTGMNTKRKRETGF